LSLVVALQLLTVLFVAVGVVRKTAAPILRWAPLMLVICLGSGLALHYPQWDRKMLSKGKYQRVETPEIRSIGWLNSLSPGSVRFPEDEREELLRYGDGVGGFTAVLKRDFIGDTHYILLNSGKPDASFPDDMATQTLFAHFGMLFHPAAKNVLIVGLASGITAGEVLNYPVERLDVVDINDEVIAASDYFREWNSDVLSDPRTRVIIQDARAHLAMTNQKYDVISSEPSNPWMAGLASLFTKDFFETVRSHLNEGGIFVQFAHTYSMDWRVFSMIGRTFATVFPNSILLNTDPAGRPGDYLLIGMKGEKKLDASVAARNLQYAQRSKNIALLDHRLFYNLIVNEDLKRLFGDGPVHTEDRPYLEFAAPKLLYVDDPAIEQNIADKEWLSDETSEIRHENSTDLDAQIDFAAYALSIYMPGFALQNRVNLSEATPAQRQKFTDLLVTYCSNNVERGVFLLKDEEIRELCVSAQMETIAERMSGASDRVPFLKRLGEMCIDAGRLDEAADYLSEVLLIDSDDVDAHSSLGIVLTRQGKHAEADDHYRKAIEIAPYSPRVYNNLGCALVEQGRTNEALVYFAESLKKDPDYPDGHYNMGNALVSQGVFAEAATHFAAAVRLKPDFVEAHLNLGNAYVAQAKFESAVFSYRAAARLRPDIAMAWYGLGVALIGQGRTSEAVEQLSKAIELAPDHVEALSSLAWTLATDSDPRIRDGVRAVSLAERACDLAGDENPLLLGTLAAAYAEAGEFDKARETARKAAGLARSAGRMDWAQAIEQGLELYDQERSFPLESE
jgi:spermidine synthase